MAFHLEWGPIGVFWSIPIAESCFAIAALWIFRKGRWKSVQI
jgi:Na+-driven multidrug efflux pump